MCFRNLGPLRNVLLAHLYPFHNFLMENEVLPFFPLYSQMCCVVPISQGVVVLMERFAYDSVRVHNHKPIDSLSVRPNGEATCEHAFWIGVTHFAYVTWSIYSTTNGYKYVSY